MDLKEIFSKIVRVPELHGRLLNTLSLMENTGARKISKCEDKVQVDLIMLKHAAEEARHAFYLKKQISKLVNIDLKNYEAKYLIASNESRDYLNLLDLRVCRYLKGISGINDENLKYAAYLLVTYAIEVRADEIYPIYQDVLDSVGSKVNVKSIILEEEGHLEEMIHQLERFWSNWQIHAEAAIEIEAVLFENWKKGIALELSIPQGEIELLEFNI